MTTPMSTDNGYRAAARRLYERDGEIEIEEFADVMESEERAGCWVSCWLFVPDHEARAEVRRAAAEAAAQP